MRPTRPHLTAARRARRSEWAFRLGCVAIVLVAAAVLLAGASASVFDRDEARFALAVREMREHGESFVPSNWGLPRYHKPILSYWCALASQNLLGAGALALRLPSLVSGLVAVAATLAMARRRFGKRVALRAGAVLATTLLFVVEAKIMTADTLLLATTTLAFWAWMELQEGARAKTRWRVLFWLAVAGGLLAKGVNVPFLLAAAGAHVAFRLLRERRLPRVLPGLFLGAALAAAVPAVAVLGPILCTGAFAWLFALDRQRIAGAWRASGAAWGLPLTIGLVSIWLVPALLATQGDFLREGVGHHLLGRTARAFEGHAGFPGYYLVTSALFLFPWAAFVPAALARTWREPRLDFLRAWIVGPWILLEASASKLPHYVLITLPAVAILVALELEQRLARGVALRGFLERALLVLPASLFCGAGLVLAVRGPAQTRLAFAGLAGLAALHLAGGLVRARTARALFVRLSLGALALYGWLGAVVLPAIEPLRLGPRLGRELAALARPDESIHLYRWSPASVGVYLPPGHPVILEEGAALAAGAHESSRLFVLQREFLDTLTSSPGSWQALASLRGFQGLRATEIVVVRHEPAWR